MGAVSGGCCAGVSPGDTAAGAQREDTFYFYQAEDGQWLFLAPFCMRALVAHYGSYAQLPARISARLLEVEELVQREAVRRRHKFLSHLPLTGACARPAKLFPARASAGGFVMGTRLGQC